VRRLLGFSCCLALLLPFQHPAFALNVESLDSNERAQLHVVLEILGPMIEAKKQDGSTPLLTWDQLFAPLDEHGRAFLNEFRTLRGETLGATSHYFGDDFNPATTKIAIIERQTVMKDGQPSPLDQQYLPANVAFAYRDMMTAMQRDLGTSLRIESGFRSPAYQLYLFMFYMPKHDYSIRETNRFVALPGHSEHGALQRQAIDFINERGINGEDHPEEFEALPEYAWLQAHAVDFGFFLSYPRNNPYNTAFEPWHWHYEE
jgi:hypothetical protein